VHLRRKSLILGISVIAVGVVAIVLVITVGSTMWRGKMYPKAPAMPRVVDKTVAELLAEHEAFLTEKGRGVLGAMQAGLSDSEIDALETKYGVKLPADLRALYRWRNGTPQRGNVDAFPDHWFVALDEALKQRVQLRKDVKNASFVQRQAYAMFAGHRDSWVDVFSDMAGDGYFFDPQRKEVDGSFFFCFAEDGWYVFFPSVRNYLAAVVEGEKSGIFDLGKQGVGTKDFTKAQNLWMKYGATPAR
jgi:cell wall assembly regulator SMI1